MYNTLQILFRLFLLLNSHFFHLLFIISQVFFRDSSYYVFSCCCAFCKDLSAHKDYENGAKAFGYYLLNAVNLFVGSLTVFG